MMWNPAFCVSWLQEMYNECDRSEVPLKDLFSRYRQNGGELSKVALGRYVQNVFPKVTVHKKWFAEDKKESSVYKGLSVKESVSTAETSEITSIQQWVQSPFFVCKTEADESKVEVAMFCDVINGNKLIKRITFCNNGKWLLHIGENEIDVGEISIQNTYSLTRESVNNVCDIVLKVHTCKGKQKENCTVTRYKALAVEFLGQDKVQIYRALNCKRIVPFTASVSTCRNCQHYIKFNEPEVPPKTDAVDRSEEENDIRLTTDNDADMRKILENILPEASGEMLDLLIIQKRNLARDPKGRRWDKKTLSLCLSLWCRSKKNYQQLRDSKVLVLPSGVTLGLYKRSVDQRAGFLNDVFIWMREEANKNRSTADQTLGGICIDEMSIQEDLCFVKSNGEVRLVGFIDMGIEADNLQLLCTGKKERPLATHVLQFLYLGLNGFRFPFACFPVTQTKASNLHFLFWQAVKYLNMYNFKVLFVSMDGAQANRDFMRMFFSDSTPLLQNFSTRNVWSPDDPDVIFIMDYSHVIKRVRNNLLKSGDGKSYVRNLCFKQHIYWEHWVNAFRWDRETNAFPLHHKLTNEHMFLTQESKMRNKLAEEVLDEDMLHLMECFQKAMGENGYLYDGSIALLKATSTIVKIFRDKRPIHDIEDVRLDSLSEALSWFNQWETQVKDQSGLASSKKEKMFISAQTHEDLNSCITGFIKLCKCTLKNDRKSIVPARINSDVIENIFCQQRGIINGNNTNPTFYQFVKNINTVILGQNTVSKNSNAANKGCEPLCFNVDRPVKQMRKSSSVRKPLATLNTGN